MPPMPPMPPMPREQPTGGTRQRYLPSLEQDICLLAELLTLTLTFRRPSRVSNAHIQDILMQLDEMPITGGLLVRTRIGRVVNGIRKQHKQFADSADATDATDAICSQARHLVDKWKALVYALHTNRV
jgi:hypothetical protein